MPEMNPLTIAGADPNSIMRTTAFDERPNTITANGNQRTDGMACMPVMSDPMAARRTGTRQTAVPNTAPRPMAMAMALSLGHVASHTR